MHSLTDLALALQRILYPVRGPFQLFSRGGSQRRAIVVEPLASSVALRGGLEGSVKSVLYSHEMY